MADFVMFGRTWQVPPGMTKAQAMMEVSAGRSDPNNPMGDDPMAGDQATYQGTSGAIPAHEEVSFESGMGWAQPVVTPPSGVVTTAVTSGVTQPGAGLEGGKMPEYDAAGNYTSAGLGTAPLALVPFVGGAVRYGASGLQMLGQYLWSIGGKVLPFIGGGVAAESLLPGDVLPFTPSGTEVMETIGDWGQAVLDLAPGGMVPGERGTRKAFLAHLSSVAGVEITAMTQMESGAWMGSYRTSPGAKRKRGLYIGPGGSPIRTWANRGMAVISRDPRGSALAKGAQALDKATNRFVRADRVAAKVKKRIRTKAKR